MKALPIKVYELVCPGWTATSEGAFMDSLSVNMSAGMLKGAQETHANAVTSLINSGAQAAGSTMSAPDDGGLRASAMQAQGIGQKLDTVA